MVAVQRHKAAITAIIIFTTIVGVMLLIRPESDGHEVETADPGVTLENVTLVGNNKGVRQWEVTAESLRQDNELIHLNRLDQMVVYEAEQPKYYLSAEQGVWSPKQNELHLSNNVVVEDQAGFYLATDQLVWHGTSESFEFMGNTSVTIHQGGKSDE
ncbi:MAG: LPS export ABC transporter periplasmic protein LptC [Firmicutes bacterium]|jgi:LPS export ABC transporter protein LptC|nr:LPS export ABC transporter periplasmic protein LptC [Bacillota bacterium]